MGRGLALIGAVLLATGVAWPTWALVVTDETGVVRWRVPIAAEAAVVLHYTNSVYRAPVWERFVVRDGRLEMVSMSSTREAVLEYNRLRPPYQREGERISAVIRGVTLAVLPLRVGAGGRPVLEVGTARLPLYQAGVGTGLRLFVRREPRLLTWFPRRAQ